MNKSAKLATSLLVFLSMATATAQVARPTYRPKPKAEVKPREGETKEDREKRETEAAELQAKQSQLAEQNYVREGMKRILGASGLEIESALNNKNLTITAPMGNQTQKVDVNPMELAKMLIREHRQNEKQANEKARADRDKELETAAKFLALSASLPFKAQMEGSNGEVVRTKLFIYLKQLSLLPEIMTKYSQEERASHLKIMNEANRVKEEDGRLTAEMALSKALENIYGKDAAKKKEQEIKDCAG